MSGGRYKEFAGGQMTEIYKNDFTTNAGGNITLSAGKSVTIQGGNGTTFGNYQYPPNSGKGDELELDCITMSMTNTILGSAYVRGYPVDVINDKGHGVIFEVPTYELIVSGVLTNGKSDSKSFTVLRYGVYHNKKEPVVVGVNTGTYQLRWGDFLGGSWHVDGAGNGKVWIHKGPVQLDKPVGANGCIELCGPSSWSTFNGYISGLKKDEPITIVFFNAVPPPIKKVKGKYYIIE